MTNNYGMEVYDTLKNGRVPFANTQFPYKHLSVISKSTSELIYVAFDTCHWCLSCHMCCQTIFSRLLLE